MQAGNGSAELLAWEKGRVQESRRKSTVVPYDVVKRG